MVGLLYDNNRLIVVGTWVVVGQAFTYYKNWQKKLEKEIKQRPLGLFRGLK